LNDVADYLGGKYGGWTDAAAKTCKQGNDWLGIPSPPSRLLTYASRRPTRRLQGLPEGLSGLP